MFKFSDIYINPGDVVAIYCNTYSGSSHPHYMKVVMRNGKEYQVNYTTKSARDEDAWRLSRMVDAVAPEVVTARDVENIVDKATRAIRRDIKTLKAEIEKED